MNPLKFLNLFFWRARYAKYKSIYSEDLLFREACKKFPTRNILHEYMHHYLKHLAPIEVREHRNYFSKPGRGFGEDAFHAMWWGLFKEFKPNSALEIGVYRGQVITLWALIAKLIKHKCDIHGISPFDADGDEVSIYMEGIDYYNDILNSFTYFDLPPPSLLKAFSTDSLAIQYIKSQKWDLIYIDGNHDYKIVLSDYITCRDSLAPNGILVIDDSSLFSDFKAPPFSFAGHFGPSKVVETLAMEELHFIGAVGHNNVFMNKNGK
jgi:hypothetical protein